MMPIILLKIKPVEMKTRKINRKLRENLFTISLYDEGHILLLKLLFPLRINLSGRTSPPSAYTRIILLYDSFFKNGINGPGREF